MAALELRNQTYRVAFRQAGQCYGFSLDTGDKQTAEALRGGVEKTRAADRSMRTRNAIAGY